jgi:hypothetical protein
MGGVLLPVPFLRVTGAPQTNIYNAALRQESCLFFEANAGSVSMMASMLQAAEITWLSASG